MATNKQKRFIEAYKEHGDATKACITAGYAIKSANVEGNRMLKNPKILAELDAWRKEKQKEVGLSKDTFVDLALNDYRSLEKTEPNAPRFLQLAGQALNIIGSGSNQPVQSTTNNVQINVSGKVDQSALWQATRKLLSDD